MPADDQDEFWPPVSRTASPATRVELRVQPEVAQRGEAIRVWTLAIDDVETMRDEALFMRPLEGTRQSKDAQTYVLVGVAAGEDRAPQVFGPGEAWEVHDIGYGGAPPLEFVVPATAIAQRYRLAVSVSVWPCDDYEQTQTEVVETILSVA